MLTFIPANIKFWILVVVMCGLGALQKLVVLEPTWSWATEVIQVLTFLEAFFTVPGTEAAKKFLLKTAPKVTSAILMLVACTALLACSSCTKQQGTEVATIGVDTLVCVLNHETDPPLQIAAECGLSDVQQVLTILDAHKAAEVRERAAAAGWDGGGLP